MASIAELLITGTQKSISEDSPNFAESYKDAATIALQREQMELKRQEIQKQQKDVMETKIGKLTQAIAASKNVDSKGRRDYLGKFIPKLRDALGLTEQFPDDALQFATSTDQNLARFGALESKVKRGELTKEAAIAIIQDPSKFVQILPLAPGELIEAPELTSEIDAALSKAETVRENAKAMAARQASQQEFQAGQADEEFARSGEKVVKQKVAADYIKFTNEGGMSGANAKIKALDQVLADLSGPNPKVKLGTITGKIPGLNSPEFQRIANPETKALVDRVRRSINLKQQLDSSFSDKAMAEVLSRAIDIGLDNKSNIEKIKALRDELKEDVRNSTTLYKRYGHPIPVNSELAPPAASLDNYPTLDLGKYDALSPSAQQLLQQKTGMSDTQIRQELGGR